MLTFPNIMLEICEKYLTELVSSKTLHYPPICELKEATNKMTEPSALGGIIPAHGSDGRPQREEVGNLSSKLVYIDQLPTQLNFLTKTGCITIFILKQHLAKKH